MVVVLQQRKLVVTVVTDKLALHLQVLMAKVACFLVAVAAGLTLIQVILRDWEVLAVVVMPHQTQARLVRLELPTQEVVVGAVRLGQLLNLEAQAVQA